MAVNKCVKYLLFFFNLLFWVAGCIILGISIYLKVTKNENKLTTDAIPAVNLMIAIGAIIMVLGFLGCCGAIKENRCMLMLFFVSLLLIFILLVAAGILGAIGAKNVETWVRDQMKTYTPLSSQPPDVIADVESIQKELKCCGILNGPGDWTKIPDSCRCNATDTGCNSSGVYSTTCTDQLIKLMKSQMQIVIGLAFAIAVLLIFGMVFSMVLYCQIGRKEGTSTA